MKLYQNPKSKKVTYDDLILLFNFDNGVVTGLSKDADAFLDKVFKNGLPLLNLSNDEKELFDLLLSNEFIALEEFESKNKPVSAYLHLTNKCNLHCVGCYSWDEKRNKYQDLTTSELLDALDKLADAGVENLVFSGGEPLLRKDIRDILFHAKEIAKIPNVILITNGTIFDKNKFEALSQYVDVVSVSVDGFSSDCPSFLRDKNIFKRIVRSIESLKTVGASVNIIPTVHHLNAANLAEYAKLASQLGVTLSFSIFTSCFEGEMKDFIPNNDDINIIGDFMIESNLPVEDTPMISGEQLVAENYCGAGRTLISIGTDGNVYPCHMLMYDEFCIGNIKDGSIEELRNSSSNYKIFESLTVDDINECFECPFKYLCGGGCRARSYLKHSNLTSKDPYCNLYKKYYEENAKFLV